MLSHPRNTLTGSLYSFIIFATVIIITGCNSGPVTPAAGKPSPVNSPVASNPNTPDSQPALPTPSTELKLESSPNVSSPLISTTLTPNISTPSATTQVTLAADEWKSLPILPSVSSTARAIYHRGLKLGNDPHAFSKIGDCQSITTYFLSYFDMPGFYNLGPYSSLQDTIDWYSGSFSRASLAVKGGFNAAAILSPLRADPTQCKSDENPVACELRLHHPSVAIISLEEWWAGHPENYEKYMRQIIETTINQGVVPILATKADNLEGNNLINQTIANLAYEYDIPLWNFWAAVQALPNHGLIATNSSGEVDMFHLTHSEGYYFYNDPAGSQSGWSMRNLTALQALDAVRRGLSEQP